MGEETATLTEAQLESFITKSVTAALDKALPKWEQPKDSPILGRLKASYAKGEKPLVRMAQGGEPEIVDSGEYIKEIQKALLKDSSIPLVDTLDSLPGHLPWGSVLVGAVPGLVVGEVIDGFLAPQNDDGSPNITNLAAKAAAAWVGIHYGSRFMGRNAAMFFAGTLALQAAAQVLPINEWIAKLVSNISGMLPGHAEVKQDAVAQAEDVIRSNQRQGPQAGSNVYDSVV